MNNLYSHDNGISALYLLRIVQGDRVALPSRNILTGPVGLSWICIILNKWEFKTNFITFVFQKF